MTKKIAVTASCTALFALTVLLGAIPARSDRGPGQQQDKEADKNAGGKKPEKPNQPQSFTKLKIKVTAGEENTAVEDALVEVTSEEAGVEYSVKSRTNKQGIVELLKVPRGKVVIRVSPHDQDTVGERRDLKTPEETALIKVKK
jgi:hypothetical protein